MTAGYEYGNTRLRARLAALLRAKDYRHLLEGDFPALKTHLEDSPIATDLDAIGARLEGPVRLATALQSSLVRSLNEMVSFYRGEARAQVEILLRRWELKSLLAILRGVASGRGREEIISRVVPIGALDQPTIAAILTDLNLRAVVDRLATFGLGWISRVLLRAWPRHADRQALGPLEHLVIQTFNNAVLCELDGEEVAPIREALLEELDALEVLAALRVRQARQLGEEVTSWAEPGSGRGWPGGSISPTRLDAISRARTTEEVVSTVEDTRRGAHWAEAFRDWNQHGRLYQLEADLRVVHMDHIAALKHSSDPLGPAIPTAYAFGVENQVRNLRVLAYGLFHGVPSEMLGERLAFGGT